MKNKLNYWSRRQVQNMYQYMQSAEEISNQIAKLYLKSSAYLSIEIDKIFDRYMAKHGLTETEALKLMESMQDKTSLNELLERLRNASDTKEKRELVKVLEAPAYRARLERLERLQNQIDEVMNNIYHQEKIVSTEHYIKLAQESYYRSIFEIQQRVKAAFRFNGLDAEQIDRVIHSKWYGRNYSARIWKNTRKLAQTLKQELLVNLVTGRTDWKLSQIIQKRFAASASASRRLVRTESSFISGEMNFKAYEECEIEKYQFLATLDLRTSIICRELDGKIFFTKDRKIGVNCNPMHPWCRSTTVSVIDEAYIKKMQRAAVDPSTGKRILVPRTMNYKEWYEKYVRGKPEAELAEKKIHNIAADRKQFSKYKEILKNDMPNRLDDFQNIKYNNADKWKFMKLDYQRRNELIKNPELKLPNAENAVLPERKFTHYLFGGKFPEGIAKGTAIDSRLGYNIENWEKFSDAIKNMAPKYPATAREPDEHGIRYEQKLVMQGLKGTPANVVVGWILRNNGEISMTSTYIKEV